MSKTSEIYHFDKMDDFIDPPNKQHVALQALISTSIEAVFNEICLTFVQEKRTEVDAMHDAFSKTENDFWPNPIKKQQIWTKNE